MFFDILSKTFQIFFSTPSLIVYPLVTWVISFIVGLVLTPLLVPQNLIVIVIVGILVGFLLVFINLMSTVASCYVVFKRLKGEDISIMDGFTLATERIGQIAAFIFLIFVVLLVGGIASAMITVIPALICLAVILWVGFIILSLGATLVYPVIAVEGLGGLEAYRRSAQLVNNTKSVTAFLFLFGFILSFILTLTVSGSITPRDIEMIQRTGTYPAVFGIFGNPVFQFVSSILTSMLSSIFAAIWYTKAVEKVDSPTP